MSDEGVLVAKSIEFIPISIDILATGPVVSIVSATGSLAQTHLVDVIDILGLEWRVTDAARYENDSADNTPFSAFEHIEPGGAELQEYRGMID